MVKILENVANLQEFASFFLGAGRFGDGQHMAISLRKPKVLDQPQVKCLVSSAQSVCQLVLLISKFTTRVLSSGPDGRTSPGFTPSSSAGGRRTVTGTTGRVGVRGIWGEGPGTSWPLIHQGRKDESSPKRCWARPFQGTVVS